MCYTSQLCKLADSNVQTHITVPVSEPRKNKQLIIERVTVCGCGASLQEW
jgi:hypothetical protein